MIPLCPVVTSATSIKLDIPPPTAIAANVNATSSAGGYVRYIHQALCSPLEPTLMQALTQSKELATIPGLLTHLIKIHLPSSTATNKGHMRHHQQGMYSMCSIQPAIIQTNEISAAHDMFCFAALANLNTGTMYTDLPGAFPIHSFHSMQYIFVVCIYDINAIFVCAIPSKNDAAMITAFTDILATLTACGYMPTLNATDNKCSKTMEAYIKSNKVDTHLVPPYNHCVNAAKHTVATF
jgi:hypothetical protein